MYRVSGDQDLVELWNEKSEQFIELQDQQFKSVISVCEHHNDHKRQSAAESLGKKSKGIQDLLCHTDGTRKSIVEIYQGSLENSKHHHAESQRKLEEAQRKLEEAQRDLEQNERIMEASLKMVTLFQKCVESAQKSMESRKIKTPAS